LPITGVTLKTHFKRTCPPCRPAGKFLENCAFCYRETTDFDCLQAYHEADSKYAMTEPSTTASFEKIVEWAYSTLPEEIRNLPDFPGIQVADEPPRGDVREDVEEKELASRH
jgi:hypothetical protein